MILFLSIGALPIGFDGFYQLLTDYGYVIYVGISIVGFFLLMGIMWVSWT